MTDKQIINSCEFQSRCIQYKDMYSNKHIKCPIVDFAIACRGENKCKYKTVYEQLKHKEQECERLKNERTVDFVKQLAQLKADREEALKQLEFIRTLNTVKEAETRKLSKTLAEIKEIAEECYYECNSMNNCNISCKYYNDCNGEFSYLLAYLNKQISEVENDNK